MKVLGLIGYPLGHSFSKIFFTEKFQEENINDVSFELFPIQEIGMVTTIIHERDDVFGLAVTKPYKELIIPFLDHLDEAAIEIGAVNCLVKKSGKWTGRNTDVIGFENSFLPLLKSHHQKALVLGMGGASKGVQYVLRKNKIDFLTVSRLSSAQKGDLFYSQIDESLLDQYKIVINCTPSGMSPNEDECPDIPYEYINANHLLYDLIYKPEETLFLQKGRAAGAQVKNGHDMFLIQAEENWKYWREAIS